jgi:hypothetical protein
MIKVMTTNDSYEQKIPRDAQYYLLVALNDWLTMEKIKKQDKDILNRKTEEAVNQWIAMNRTDRTIFINRVLYEYWTKTKTRFTTFFTYRDFIRGKAEEIRQKQQYSSRSKEDTHSSSKSHLRITPRLANAYAILGLSLNADKQQIKNAYRKLVKQHHPDAGGDAQKFIKVQTAYETLLSTKEAS